MKGFAADCRLWVFSLKITLYKWSLKEGGESFSVKESKGAF